MTACPTCSGSHEPGECKAQSAEQFAAVERRKRVVETARMFATAAQADPTHITDARRFFAYHLGLAEAFETAAEKYVKGEK